MIVTKLVEADALIFPKGDVVDITRKRKSVDIQSEYLGFEYDWPVCIVRVLDSLRERFKLGPLYANRYPVAVGDRYRNHGGKCYAQRRQSLAQHHV